MVQAGVNPFPAGPGFTAAPTLNATDGNLPVAVSVKNDALATTLKPETSINITPAISVTQASFSFIWPMAQGFVNDFCDLQAFQPPGSQFSPVITAQPVSQASVVSASLPLPLPCVSVSIANAIEKPAVSIITEQSNSIELSFQLKLFFVCFFVVQFTATSTIDCTTKRN